MTETIDPDAGPALGGAGAHRPSPRALCVHLGVVLLVGSSGAALIGGASAAGSTALGVGISAANLLAMRQITRALSAASGAAAAWGLAFPVKLAALVGVAFVLVERGVAKPVWLAIGFALLPLTGVFLPRTAAPARAPRAPARGGSLEMPANPMKHRA